MFDKKKRYIIENYNKANTFSSFLPGISGVYGIPIWCFYVNRGQGIASFGVENKDYSIMEFYPAHQAYQKTKTMGFRTFMKIDGNFYEPFRADDAQTKMYIGMNELEIEEINTELGVKINVTYFTLPNEDLGGLVRNVRITNLSGEDIAIEVLDGMPAIIPYGIELKSLKEMAQTMKAWMQVEDIESNIPYYRVRVSTKDSAAVTEVKGGNFMLSVSEAGEQLPILADPELIFDYDTSFDKPVQFIDKDLESLIKEEQILQNQVPCGFTCIKTSIQSGESKGIHTIIGQAQSKEKLKTFAKTHLNELYFQEKQEQSRKLTEDLGQMIATKSGDMKFDSYCKQTYIDNVLRGGYPIQIGEENVYYVYSRKHGDIERDYNFFSMLPEFFSQGNGNFRDVNQNRRSDVLFTPFVKDYNIKMFYNLIQLDGYNPLVVKQVSYQVTDINSILKMVKESKKNLVQQFFESEFSPGKLVAFLKENKIELECDETQFLECALNSSKEILNADFGEGYWSDHWTYNLDLIDSYLSIYPEKEEELLFDDNSYTYYESKAVVNKRIKRYKETEKGIRQYDAVDEEIKSTVVHTEARTLGGNGEVYYSNLMTKLLVLAVNKFATLDMFGMGIEMEAGKPGWYDALNGLPGILGSSMVESYELKRMLTYMIVSLEKYQRAVPLPIELKTFMDRTYTVLCKAKENHEDTIKIWNGINREKECYRKRTAWGILGEVEELGHEDIIKKLKSYHAYLSKGIEKAYRENDGIPPTYFSYSMDAFEEEGGDIHPINLKQEKLPLFLEGPVRFLKIADDFKTKKELHEKVKTTNLYDKKLKMYKVNESLESASYEVGRAKAFSPGWLENESIWLHMEYKYILELLKSQMYDEFFQEFKNVAVPFLDDATYGRSPLENSSFIVSSANENKKLHGRGFVARLSGSTAEFLQIWQLMMFGEKLFSKQSGELTCLFEPAIPKYLISDSMVLEVILFGKTKVFYECTSKNDVVPGRYTIEAIKLVNNEEKIELNNGENLSPELANLVRKGTFREIYVKINN